MKENSLTDSLIYRILHNLNCCPETISIKQKVLSLWPVDTKTFRMELFPSESFFFNIFLLFSKPAKSMDSKKIIEL